MVQVCVEFFTPYIKSAICFTRAFTQEPTCFRFGGYPLVFHSTLFWKRVAEHHYACPESSTLLTGNPSNCIIRNALVVGQGPDLSL